MMNKLHDQLTWSATRRTWIRCLVALLLLLLGLSGSARAGVALPAAAQSAPMLGFHIHRGDAAHLGAAHAAGGQFVVLVFSWQDIEPTPNYLYWERTDSALMLAEYFGLGVVARLDRPPDWALTQSGPAPWRVDAYAAFVQRVVARYGERLDGVILWNEPNLSLEWAGRAPDTAGYAALARAGYAAAKSVAPDLPVLLAGLAFTMGDGVAAVNDLDYMADLLALDVPFDGVAAHPYGFGVPPDQAPAVDRLNFRRLELHRDLLEQAGRGDAPIWITEMGWRKVALDAADKWQAVGEAKQAEYTLDALRLAAAYPWLERLAWWELNGERDLYGYALWEGEGRVAPAYAALVERAVRRCGGACQPAGAVRTDADGHVILLERDVRIRLGDIGTLHPHWVHLLNGGESFSPTWEHEFFLTGEQAAALAELVVETMQVDQPSNEVRINGVWVGRLAPRARPDPTSTWATQRLALPVGLLQPGLNRIQVRVGLRNPARQFSWWRWENLQLRAMRLAPTPVSAPTMTWAWEELPSLPGWGEVTRVRVVESAEGERGLWVMTNRSGGLWQADWTDGAGVGPLRHAAGGATAIFTDLLAWGDELLAATGEGLRGQRAGSQVWTQVHGAPTGWTYAVAASQGLLFAGFEGAGVWQAQRPGGPWRLSGLPGRSVLDLVEDGEGVLYAATDRGVYRRDGVTWSRLPDIVADDTTAYDQFVSRLFTDQAGGIVALRLERLWRSRGEQGWQPFGPQALQGRMTTVFGCCGDGAGVGTNGLGLWTRSGDTWRQEDGDPFVRLEVVGGASGGDALIVGTTNGLFVRQGSGGQDDATWQAVIGLPAAVTALVVDVTDGRRLFAATPVGVYSAAHASAPWQAISPPWVVWNLVQDGAGRLYAARGNGIAWSDTPLQGGWVEASGMETVTFFGIHPDLHDGQTLWAGTWGNNIGVSRDRGASFAPLHNGLETLSALDVWQHLTPGQMTIGTIEGLFRTDDGGASWFKLPGALAEQTVYAVRQSGDGRIWAGAANGLWFSDDYGVTWSRQRDVPQTTVIRLGMLADKGGLLWAGTEADGLWLSRDGGATWQGAGPRRATVYALVQDVDGEVLLATDGGVWRLAR